MASFIFYGADAAHIHTYFIFKRCAEVLLPSTSQTPTNRALSAFNLQYNVLKGTREASLATLITLEHSPISRPSFNTPHPLQNIFQKSSHNVIILLITQAVRKSGSRQFKPPPIFGEVCHQNSESRQRYGFDLSQKNKNNLFCSFNIRWPPFPPAHRAHLNIAPSHKRHVDLILIHFLKMRLNL